MEGGPINQKTGERYFEILDEGWGTGWGADHGPSISDAMEALQNHAIALGMSFEELKHTFRLLSIAGAQGAVAGEKLKITMWNLTQPKKKKRGNKWKGYPKTKRRN